MHRTSRTLLVINLLASTPSQSSILPPLASSCSLPSFGAYCWLSSGGSVFRSPLFSMLWVSSFRLDSGGKGRSKLTKEAIICIAYVLIHYPNSLLFKVQDQNWWRNQTGVDHRGVVSPSNPPPFRCIFLLLKKRNRFNLSMCCTSPPNIHILCHQVDELCMHV